MALNRLELKKWKLILVMAQSIKCFLCFLKEGFDITSQSEEV